MRAYVRYLIRQSSCVLLIGTIVGCFAFAQSTLIFPHIGNGFFGDIAFKSSIILFNTHASNASVSVQFYGQDGTSLSLDFGLAEASELNLEIPLGGVVRIETSGEGPGRVGWAEIRSEQRISGSATFTLLGPGGTFLSEVGVPDSPSLGGLSVFVHTTESLNTALALVNPGAEVNSVALILLDSSGKEVSTKELSLGPREHIARFVTEIFEGVQGIGAFEGSLRVIGTNKLSAVTLRSKGVQFTSLPVVP